MKIGVVACNIMQRELEKLLADMPGVEEIVWLDGALHVHPEKMKETIREEVNKFKGRVDVVFLGYGYCQSLKGLDQEFDFPVILPQVDDCIALLLTPERYAEEIRKEVGTWFMTPGWAEVGAEMVIKELRLDRAARYGKDPRTWPGACSPTTSAAFTSPPVSGMRNTVSPRPGSSAPTST